MIMLSVSGNGVSESLEAINESIDGLSGGILSADFVIIALIGVLLGYMIIRDFMNSFL